MRNAKQIISELLTWIWVYVNWTQDYDIHIHNEKFYDRVLTGGSLALWESYMDWWWDCDRIDVFVEKLLRADLSKIGRLSNIPLFLKSSFFNLQTLHSSKEVIDKHYDLDNNLFTTFLDPYNQYSCWYFKDTDDLHVAQEQKLDLICRKLQLNKSDKVLDIGCGWWGFARFAAEHYGCEVVWITISKEQQAYAESQKWNLPVKYLLQDYRLMHDRFSKVVSIWMFEHVGYKNYQTLFDVVNRCLDNEWLFLLHTIWWNESVTKWDPWLDKYIFPNWMLPSVAQIWKAAEKNFVMEDWHNFGPYYALTLLEWNKRFEANWTKIKAKYDDRFFRMFRYYFLICAGTFNARKTQLWQVVFSKWAWSTVYESVR